MNKTTEALKLAEEALEELHYSSGTVKSVTLYKSALAAIREVLAEQQDKPEECAYGCPENTVCDYCQRAESVKQEPIGEHDLQDVRCECCGYMTHHREHMGCIRAAYIKPAPVQPVKQEPVAWTATRLWNSKDTWSCPADIEKDLLYAAPVDAKAIRAEALEEAAKVCDEISVDIPYNCAAAIRGLK